MTKISRLPSAAARQTYDLIIVGGGIYGAMLSLEAALRGLKPLLLERDDFGGATSFNSLRIIHGGFRYLQHLDWRRYAESVHARHWFLQHFPHLMQPLPCLMPLYGSGVYTPSVLRAALCLNDLLSCDRNQGVLAPNHLPAGQIITAEQVKQYFPLVQMQGLKGGAIWYDASLKHPQRLLIGILRRSCALGGVALNYVEAQALLRAEHSVAGVVGQDVISGESHEYQAKVVVNAAGPWCREVAARCDRDVPALFRRSLAWNILFDREALSKFALAVHSLQPKAKTYFLCPLNEKLFAGTVHSSWFQGIVQNPRPLEPQVVAFIQDLNAAIPHLDLHLGQIHQIYAGFLPVTEENGVNLLGREVIWNHGCHQGIHGLYSVSGVKLTTSHLVAQKTISTIFPESQPLHAKILDLESLDQLGIFSYSWKPEAHDLIWKADLKKIISEESVQHLDDLILRRTNLSENLKKALDNAEVISELFVWDKHLRQEEVLRLKRKVQKLNSLQPEGNSVCLY